MVRRHGDGGLKSTVRSSGGHADTGVVAGVIMVVVEVIGRHERATSNAIPASIGPKAAAATVHLAPLLGLLDLSLSVVNGDMNARSAHHGDGIILGLG